MLEAEVIQAYHTEIKYQEHMLENLKRWFSLAALLASLGWLIIYLFASGSLWGLVLGGLVGFLGVIAMLLIGYGIYKGRQNLLKLIDHLESGQRK